MCTLVSSKATAETNHQCVRVDTLKDRNDLSWIALITEPLLGELITDILDEFLLQCHTCLPDFSIWHIVDSVPDRLVTLVAHEALVKVLIVNLTPLCCGPCWEVYTIGYITYSILLREVPLPQWSKHLLAYPTVKL